MDGKPWTVIEGKCVNGEATARLLPGIWEEEEPDVWINKSYCVTAEERKIIGLKPEEAAKIFFENYTGGEKKDG